MERRYVLMNSAMMPSPNFVYQPRLLSQEEFVQLLQEAQRSGQLESYIGYETTASHIAKISGVSVSVNRAETQVQEGDVMLVCKLRYRLPSPSQKANPQAQAAISDEDFEYWLIEVMPKQNSQFRIQTEKEKNERGHSHQLHM
ncbi:MAG: DUF1874 domain-containing protein [Candidatus Methanomethylicaceae archaeon]